MNMTLTDDIVDLLAGRLEQARRDKAPIGKITDDYPALTVDAAYDVQDRLRAIQVAGGLGVAGLKMGFTSRAKMAQMNVKDPINGYLTQAGRIAPGGSVSRGAYIFPRVEAEIAVITGRELSGPGCTIAQVQAAIAEVRPALEVIDSRYRNYGFDLPSVIADNTSAAAFMVGDDGVPVAGLDLKAMGVVIERNGEIAATAAGAAVLGSPLNSVALLANMLGRRGRSIPAGTLILTGGITEAVPINPGDHFAIRFQTLGRIDLATVA
jgi:2-oxo-3-hexenedioate decarboxylase